jgi:hypothetical protein
VTIEAIDDLGAEGIDRVVLRLDHGRHGRGAPISSRDTAASGR